MMRIRRSLRRDFLEKDVSNELILKIIKAGMQSPSAKNQQPWEFYIVKNKELIGKVDINDILRIMGYDV